MTLKGERHTLDKETADDLKGLQDKKVLARCDFSVLLKEGVTQSYNRINGAIPTTEKLLDQGAKVILYSHLGKPKGEPVPEMNLVPAASALNERPGAKVKFVDDPRITGSETRKVAAKLKDGEVLLLQNTRYRGEETRLKDGDTVNEAYVKELVDLCDGVFANDTSGIAHGTHCSNVGIIRFIKENVVDYLIERRVKLPGQAIENPVRLFVAILDGARVSSKINVISNLLDRVDTLITGGDMACTLTKAQGQEIGNSLYEIDRLDYALETTKRVEGKGARLLLPVDHMEGEGLSSDMEHKVADVIDAGWSGSDIRPRATVPCKEALQGAKTAAWNGSVDVSELSNFAGGTLEVYRAVADLADATTVVGGGGSISAAERLGFTDKMTHISTDGGTSLELLEGRELLGMIVADSRA